MDFSQKITLPTCLSDHLGNLIDNIFTNNIDDAGASGILLNSISYRQLKMCEVPKFIEIERSDDRSMHDFVNELDDQYS